MQSDRSRRSWDAARSDLERHKASGLTGTALFEAVASDSLRRKLDGNGHRCQRCWHARSACICTELPPLSTTLPVKILVLMHYREYYSAGDDAKLLLAMMPSACCENFIFGRQHDFERLRQELAVDPVHTLILWPGRGASTVKAWRASRPTTDGWGVAASAASSNAAGSDQPPTRGVSHRPLLRVVVLDGVYAHARLMFKTLATALEAEQQAARQAADRILHVALHPKTLSLYHRAQGGYAEASATTVRSGGSDPLALRICTLEAVALLLEELGEPKATTEVLLRALLANNRALQQQQQREEAARSRPRPRSADTGAESLALRIRLVCCCQPAGAANCFSSSERSAVAVEVSLVVL